MATDNRGPNSPNSPSFSNSPRALFRMPDASDLFPPIPIDVRDLEPARHNTLLQALVREMQSELYRLRTVAVRAGSEGEASYTRGRVEGVEWVLAALDRYYTPDVEIGEDEGDGEGADNEEDEESDGSNGAS